MIRLIIVSMLSFRHPALPLLLLFLVCPSVGRALTVDGGGYTMELPEGWERLKVKFSVTEDFNGRCPLPAPHEEYFESLFVTIAVLPKSADLARYMSDHMRVFRNALNISNMSGPVLTEVGGLPAYQIHYRQRQSNLVFDTAEFLIFQDTHVFRVTYAVPIVDGRDYALSLAQIMQSFTPKAASPPTPEELYPARKFSRSHYSVDFPAGWRLDYYDKRNGMDVDARLPWRSAGGKAFRPSLVIYRRGDANTLPECIENIIRMFKEQGAKFLTIYGDEKIGEEMGYRVSYETSEKGVTYQSDCYFVKKDDIVYVLRCKNMGEAMQEETRAAMNEVVQSFRFID